jgi:hypothetical protein
MAAINVNDFSIDYINKTIRYAGAETPPYPLADMLTVNALYSYIMDTFDESAQMDDTVPMSAQTPTDYSLINQWFMDEKSIQTLKGGAIKTTDWNGQIAILNVSGITTQATTSDIGKQVKDDSVEIGPLLYPEAQTSTTAKWWIRTTNSIANASVMTITGSSANGNANGASKTGENIWTNLYTLGTLYLTPTLYITRDKARLVKSGINTDAWWSTGHIDVLVLIKEGGVELGSKLAGGDTGWVQVFDRDWTDGTGTLWDWFEVDLGPGGRQAVPLATFADINNTTALATVSGWSNVVVSASGPYSRDIGDGQGFKNYDYTVDCAGRTLAQVYERLKYITRAGEITVIASGIQGQMYTVIAGQEAVYAPSKQAPFGTFAGGTFFGARGIWISNMAGADAEKYLLIDSAGTNHTPPTQAPVTVGSVVAGDRVLVAKSTGAASTVIDKAQYTVSGTLASGVNYIHVMIPIPNDTPASGFIRVLDVGLSEERYTYSGYGHHTFGLNTNTIKQYVGPTDTAYVPYIDNTAISTSIVQSLLYVTPRNLVARVRKKGILPFETTATLVTGGVTITAIRTTDGIVT